MSRGASGHCGYAGAPFRAARTALRTNTELRRRADLACIASWAQIFAFAASKLPVARVLHVGTPGLATGWSG